MTAGDAGLAAAPLQEIAVIGPAAIHSSDTGLTPGSSKSALQTDSVTPAAKGAKPTLPYYKLFSYADRFDVLLMLLGCFGGAVSGATLPTFSIVFGTVINTFGDSPTITQLVHEVNKICVYFVILGIVAFIGTAAENGLWMWTGVRQTNRMRHAYLASVLQQEVAYFDTDTSSGKLLNGLNEDTVAVQAAISEKVGNFVHHVSTIFVGIAIAFAKAWDIALVILALLPVLLAVGGGISLLVERVTAETGEAYGQANGIASEALAAIRTVLSFNGEGRTVQRYRNSLTKPMQAGIKGGFFSGLLLGFSNMAFLCSFALALWYGGLRVRDGKYTGGDVLSALFAALVGGAELGQAAGKIKFFQRGKAAAVQLFAVIQRQPLINDSHVDTGAAAPPANCEGNVELRDVRFAYPSRPDSIVLKHFSLQVPAGKTVALVGESGSGKSTIVGLLERFYDPQQGQVLLDGRNVRGVPLAWLRGQVGLVSQEPVLFATTIARNIAFGRPGASWQDIQQAAMAANAHNFITSLPQGYNTLVGERGVQMSGGQKQRIAIARAILKNPKVLLLDEATSALDSESERVVQAALEGLMAGRTTLIIAHRLSTIMQADHIAVMKSGEIVEQGSHRELMQIAGGAYATLVRLQASVHAKSQDAVQPYEPKLEPSKAREAVQAYSTSQDQMETQIAVDTLAADKQTAAQTPAKGGNKKGQKEKQDKVKAGFVRLLALNRPEWLWAVLGSIASAGLGVIYPGFGNGLATIIGAFYNPDLQEEKQEVQTWCIIFAGVGAGMLLCGTVQQYAFTLMGQKLTRRLRVMLMTALLRQEVGWHDRTENSSGAVAGRLSSDTLSIRGAVGDQLGVIIQNLACLIAAYTIAFTAGWRMTLVITAAAPLIGLGAWIEGTAMLKFADKASKQLDAANQTAAEAVNNARTVAAFTLQPQLSQLYQQQLLQPTRSVQRNSFVSGFGIAWTEGCIYALYALGFWFGGRQVAAGTMTFTQILKVFFCVAFAAGGVASAQMAFPDITKASGAVKRVFSVIDRQPGINPNTASGLALGKGGSVELRGVGFRYPARHEVQVLRQFSLRVAPGRSLALVGQSGSGKSTIISLIQRFYDVQQGQVLVDGYDVRDLDLHELRGRVGLVSQEPILFSCSVRDNICYANPDASQQQIEDAARAANAHSFVEKLPDGYSTQVGEGGIQLSGGQKQRVAIARAILKDPKILLLDEATSALDAESERLVQQALERLMVGRTTIIVAHRLSTIKNADSIAVVQQGEIVEQGTHDQLMQISAGSYASLIKHQQQA